MKTEPGEYSWADLVRERKTHWDGVTNPQAQLNMRAMAGFPANKPGVISGVALEGYLPGLSRGDDGSPVSAFRVEPRFLFGLKM